MATYTKETKRTIEEKKILSVFASNIREARNKLGISQEEVAHQAGFSRSYYTEIETGHRNISLLNLYKILKVLKVQPNDLIMNLEDD